MRYITCADAARRLGITRQAIQHAVANNRIRHRRVYGALRIDAEDLERYRALPQFKRGGRPQKHSKGLDTRDTMDAAVTTPPGPTNRECPLEGSGVSSEQS